MESELRKQLMYQIDCFQDAECTEFLGLFMKKCEYYEGLRFVIVTKDLIEGKYHKFGHIFEWTNKELHIVEYGAYESGLPFDPGKENYEEVSLAEFFKL